MLGIQQLVSYTKFSLGLEQLIERSQSHRIPTSQKSSSFGKVLWFLLPLASARTINGTNTDRQISDHVSELTFNATVSIAGVIMLLALIYSIKTCHQSGLLNPRRINIAVRQPVEPVARENVEGAEPEQVQIARLVAS